MLWVLKNGQSFQFIAIVNPDSHSRIGIWCGDVSTCSTAEIFFASRSFPIHMGGLVLYFWPWNNIFQLCPTRFDRFSFVFLHPRKFPETAVHSDLSSFAVCLVDCAGPPPWSSTHVEALATASWSSDASAVDASQLLHLQLPSKIFATEDTHCSGSFAAKRTRCVKCHRKTVHKNSMSDMFLLGGIFFPQRLWSCASKREAMVLRCLVVDCGGVTHPDSGLKEAGFPGWFLWANYWMKSRFVAGKSLLVSITPWITNSKSLTLKLSKFYSELGWLRRILGSDGRKISGRLPTTKNPQGSELNPHSKNHKSIKFAWIVVTMPPFERPNRFLGSEFPCEGDEGEEIFRCKGCKCELIQQLDSEKIPWKSL